MNMKSIIQAMLQEIFSHARDLSVFKKQTVGKDNEFYITLEQLLYILKHFED